MTTTAATKTFWAVSGTTAHVLDREVATRFGTRFVAKCGTSAYHITTSDTVPVSCARCQKVGS